MVTGVDFLPAEYWKRRASQRDQVYLLAIGGALLILLLGSLGHETRKTGLIRQQLAGLEREYQNVLEQMEEVKRLESRRAPMAFDAKAYSLLRAHPSLSRVMVAVAASCPPHLTLSSINLRGVQVVPPDPTNASSGRRGSSSGAGGAGETQNDQLERFAREREQTRYSLIIVGVAETDIDIVKLVERLEQSGCFTEEPTFSVADNPSNGPVELRKFTIQCVLTKVL